MGESKQLVVRRQSDQLGSSSDPMIIDDEAVYFSGIQLSKSDINRIEATTSDERDIIGLFAVFLHLVTGSILAYTVLSASVLSAVGVLVTSVLLGIAIVKTVRQQPFAHFEIHTDEQSFTIGVASSTDVALLYKGLKDVFPTGDIVGAEE